MFHKIYIAAPLFSDADRHFNKLVYDRIETYFNMKGKQVEIYLPQLNEEINDKRNFANSLQIFNGDTAHLEETSILIAMLDGTVVDPGVAAEIGYFSAMCEVSNGMKHIVGLFTDNRDATNTPAGESMDKKSEYMNSEVAESQFPYVNLYVIGAVKKHGKICKNIDEIFKYFDKLLKENNEKKE